MAREVSIELLNAELDNLRVELENLNDNLRDAYDELEVAKIDLTNAREEIRRVSGGESATILWQLGALQSAVDDAYYYKEKAKTAVRKWTTIVKGLEAKISEIQLKIDSGRTALLLEIALSQIGQ
jgi:septation ring formation regulator EzrA